MRAIVQRSYGDADVLTLTDVPRPEPRPTEILVRVHAAGVNPVDLGVRQGTGAQFLGLHLPLRPGWDVSGVVEQVGAGVTRFAVGDEVFGMPLFPRPAGTFAEYVAAPSRHFTRKPPGIDHITAAAVPLAGLTAWQALVDTAIVKPGQRVLVHAAAGGVGHLAVQIAKARGAYVLGTTSQRNHHLVKRLGVDEPIDYRTCDFAATVRDVDIVIDLVGGDYGRRSLECLRPGGTLVEIAGNIDQDFAEAASAQGIRALDMIVEPDGTGLDGIGALLTDGTLQPLIAATYPLAEAGIAQDALRDGRTVGKVVLTVRG